MEIKDLKKGLKVRCPEDRGDKSYEGIIISFSNEINENIQKVKYAWVTVERNGVKTKHAWSSNRLQKI